MIKALISAIYFRLWLWNVDRKMEKEMKRAKKKMNIKPILKGRN